MVFFATCRRERETDVNSVQKRAGFTLVELLLVIAVISIMSALVISAITNAAQDSRAVIARQQQVVLQEALNAWISANASGSSTLETVRATYEDASTPLAKLDLIKNYLHAETYEHFSNFSTSSEIKTDAMNKVGLHVEFSGWDTTNYPMVEMVQ